MHYVQLQHHSNLLFEELYHLESNQKYQRQYDYQHENDQPALPVAAVLDDMANALGGCSQPRVRHINILVQLLQQRVCKSTLFTYREGNVLTSPQQFTAGAGAAAAASRSTETQITFKTLLQEVGKSGQRVASKSNASSSTQAVICANRLLQPAKAGWPSTCESSVKISCLLSARHAAPLLLQLHLCHQCQAHWLKHPRSCSVVVCASRDLSCQGTGEWHHEVIQRAHVPLLHLPPVLLLPHTLVLMTVFSICSSSWILLLHHLLLQLHQAPVIQLCCHLCLLASYTCLSCRPLGSPCKARKTGTWQMPLVLIAAT